MRLSDVVMAGMSGESGVPPVHLVKPSLRCSATRRADRIRWGYVSIASQILLSGLGKVDECDERVPREERAWEGADVALTNTVDRQKEPYTTAPGRFVV